MKDLLDKLSSYNLFNYLLPGTLFAVAAEHISEVSFTHENIIINFFIFYFIGLVISRLGSLVVEPVLTRTKFLKSAPYKDFIRACDHDSKIEVLSEQNNMYRTLCTLFVVLPAFNGFDVVATHVGLTPTTTLLFAFGILAALFAVAYRKETSFIKKRVEALTR